MASTRKRKGINALCDSSLLRLNGLQIIIVKCRIVSASSVEQCTSNCRENGLVDMQKHKRNYWAPERTSASLEYTVQMIWNPSGQRLI